LAKDKIAFFCRNCGHEAAKWTGQCASCKEWNTYVEEKIVKSSGKAARSSSWSSKDKKIPTQSFNINNIPVRKNSRLLTKDEELNRVLGGGIVLGSLILLGGAPGIGKSTLLLQSALRLEASVLYVSGEESMEQLKLRADRIGVHNTDCFILTETNLIKVLQEAEKSEPGLIVIDSIQTVYTPHLDATAGSISQIRECTALLQRFSKETNTPIIIIGHITKEGTIAGPKLLEHIVDVVIRYEGDQHYNYRILRGIKNRFGSTDEIGIYEMHAKGLREVSNPSELLLAQSDERLSGSAVSATLEGNRPLLIECQALVTTAVYGTPQRSATGFDLRRLSMLLAVLEKRCGLIYGNQDVFMNIAGGLKIVDPAIDLGIVAALVSSYHNISISNKYAFAGEIGLSGEIRTVNRIENRIQEANRLGFEKIFISKYSMKGVDVSKLDIEVIPLGKVDDLLKLVFA